MKAHTHNKLSELFANIIYTVKKWFLVFALLLVILMLCWSAWTEWGWGNCVVHNPNGVGLASDRIEAAMLNMGPRYYYDLYPDGTLKVKLNGQWLRLRY